MCLCFMLAEAHILLDGELLLTCALFCIRKPAYKPIEMQRVSA